MAEFVVHGIPGSPYVRSVLLGLEEKGAPYRLAAMGFGQHKRPEHLARHPFGKIPALEHGDFQLYETQAILRYLDDVMPKPAFEPAGARARARVNQLVGIADSYVRPLISGAISFERVVVPLVLGGTPNEEKIKAALAEAGICIGAIEALMAEPFLAGDSLSLADLMLAPHLSYFAMTPEGRAMMGERLKGWIARMEGRPSMQATTFEKMRAMIPKVA
jgi:glutathione S-transferase